MSDAPLSPMKLRLNAKARALVRDLAVHYNLWHESRVKVLDALEGKRRPERLDWLAARTSGEALIQAQRRLGVELARPDLIRQALDLFDANPPEGEEPTS